MIAVYRHEIKAYWKSVMVWFCCVGGMGFACILLYSGMKESMEAMAENFAAMGAFSDVFGMSRLSIATMEGFYAAEVGTIHGLGGAMFAAIVGTGMLSKEEEGHTGEFLFSLPVARGKVVIAKWCAVITQVVLFNLLCVGFYFLGFGISGETISAQEFFIYHAMQILMQSEIAAVCYGMSAFLKKNKLGLGIGIVLFLYACDLLARVIPDLADYKMFSPFFYANAADVFSTGEIAESAAAIGVAAVFAGVCIAYVVYTKRDLAA